MPPARLAGTRGCRAPGEVRWQRILLNTYMSMKTATAVCWLCGKNAPLTKEHIPARRAFNSAERPLTLQRVAASSHADGILRWEDDRTYTDGFSRASLCLECIQRSGRRFVNSYLALTDQIAHVSRHTQCGRFIQVNVRNPSLVLRQVLHQFVTANGREFVERNVWIRDFIVDPKRRSLPEDVFVYLYAMKEQSMRITGIGGTVFLDKNKFAVLSEFSFWPLGTVLSFNRLEDWHLSDVSHWAGANKGDTCAVNLCMSHTISPSFIDSVLLQT